MSVDGICPPVPNKVLVAHKITTEDDDTQFWHKCGLANERDETIPTANATVEPIMLPRLAMAVNGLSKGQLSYSYR